MSKTLDLGCGINPRNYFNADEVFGIDIVDFDNINIKVADLVIEPIPFDDNSFQYVTAFDFLEHVPKILYIDGKRKQPFIEIMSEVWRVLEPNGEAFFSTPAYPHIAAFQDPQHVNYITTETINYFAYSANAGIESSMININRSYGFKGTFEIIEHSWNPEFSDHLIWHLRAIK